jgi:hypothetical protein
MIRTSCRETRSKCQPNAGQGPQLTLGTVHSSRTSRSTLDETTPIQAGCPTLRHHRWTSQVTPAKVDGCVGAWTGPRGASALRRGRPGRPLPSRASHPSSSRLGHLDRASPPAPARGACPRGQPARRCHPRQTKRSPNLHSPTGTRPLPRFLPATSRAHPDWTYPRAPPVHESGRPRSLGARLLERTAPGQVVPQRQPPSPAGPSCSDPPSPSGRLLDRIQVGNLVWRQPLLSPRLA